MQSVMIAHYLNVLAPSTSAAAQDTHVAEVRPSLLVVTRLLPHELIGITNVHFLEEAAGGAATVPPLFSVYVN